MAGVRKSADMSQIAARLRMSETNRAPTVRDIQAMFLKSKEMPGSIIEWVWTETSNQRQCTLTTKFPYFRDRDWWDYELKDDPDWCLSDDRAQGNNVVWEYKTSDIDLVIEIVNMMQSNARKAADKARSTDAGGQTDLGPRSAFSTPVFPALVSSDPEPDPTRNLQQVFPALAYSRFTGKVEICSEDKIGEVFFEYGVPVHASFSKVTGDSAAREIISWRIGNVKCSQDERSETRSVTRPIDYLLREGQGLLEQKKYLAQHGLSYESYVIRSGKGDGSNLAPEQVLPKRIFDYVERRRTLTDVMRDLQVVEASEWVPALCELLRERLVVVKPPAKERRTNMDFVRNVDDQADHLYSPDTGIYKYEAFLSFLQREFQLFQEQGVPVSLIVFEMSTKGERIDQKNQWLSSATASLIAEKIELLKRPLDTFAHFQMLDFVLLMPHTELSQATFVAERIEHALTSLPLKPDQKERNLIVYCGVANLPAQGASLKSLITAAELAKDQAREWQWPIVTSQSDQALVERASQAVHPAFRKLPDESDDGPVQLQDLLIRSGLVSPENFETAFLLSEKMHMPIARVLSIEGHIQQPTVEAALQVLAMCNEHQLSVDNAIRALQLVGNHGVEMETALKRLGTVKHTAKKHRLGELLKAAGIIKRTKLDQELRHCVSVGLPLGCVLVNKGILSQYTLQAALMILRFIKDNGLSREDGIKALKAVHSGSSSLRQYLRDNNIEMPEPESGLAELLVLGRLMTDLELMSAREIELLEGKDLESLLRKNGFVTEVGFNTAKQLLVHIADGKMNRDQAAQILQNNKHKTEMPDLDKLLAIMAHLHQKPAEEAPPPPPIDNTPVVPVVPAVPAVPPLVESPFSAPPQFVIARDPGFARPAETVSETKGPSAFEALRRSSAEKSQSIELTSPPIEIFSKAVTGAIPHTPSEVDARAETGEIPQFTASELDAAKAETGEIPQIVSQTQEPDAQTVVHDRSDAPIMMDADHSAVDERVHIADPQSPDDARVHAPAAPVEESPKAPPEPRPQRKTTPTMEIDRVKLLRTADFLGDKQIKEALRISKRNEIPLLRTLFDLGEIDQPSVNLAAAAKRHIESGRIDIAQAVKVMRHCKENKILFDEGLEALEKTW